MRYFTVGAPVEDYKQFLFIGAKPRHITQSELERNSFYKQKTLRIFTSFDDAKEYAHGLRCNAHDFAHPPKTTASRSKVRPVFTLELDIELGELKNESFKYNESYTDEHRMSQTREKEILLNFYDLDSSLINKNNIIRAEFFQSGVAPVEFQHEKPRSAPVLS